MIMGRIGDNGAGMMRFWLQNGFDDRRLVKNLVLLLFNLIYIFLVPLLFKFGIKEKQRTDRPALMWPDRKCTHK